MPTDVSEGVASPKASPATGEGSSPVSGAVVPEVGGAGESSDEGGEEEEVVNGVSDGEYSEEDTDEEVCTQL